MDLIEFLRARYDEVEALAAAAVEPDRILRDVAAKRALVDLWEIARAATRTPQTSRDRWWLGAACELGIAIKWAAAAFDDHSDYDEAWRP